MPLMCTCVLSCALSSGVISKIFSNSLSRFIGKISFSLYLVHWQCLSIIELNLKFTETVELFIGVLVTLVTSCILYYLVERPSMRIGKNLLARVQSAYHWV